MTDQNKPRPARPKKPGPFKAAYAKGKTADHDTEMMGSSKAGNLFLVKEVFRAVCQKCHVYLSPRFRDTEDQADSDGRPHHTATGHRYGIERTYIS